MSDHEIVTHLHFIRPFESEADAITTLEKTKDGVKVTWSYHDETPYHLNVINLFLNMDAMLGPDFDKGVHRLKELVEKQS